MLYLCCIVLQLLYQAVHMTYFHVGINNHNPTEGIPTLTQWWGLRGQMILRSMLAVV